MEGGKPPRHVPLRHATRNELALARKCLPGSAADPQRVQPRLPLQTSIATHVPPAVFSPTLGRSPRSEVLTGDRNERF
jgi:hypothetical protein